MDNIKNLIDDGAIFYVSHSGGKDSQAMYAHLSAMIPADQIVVVHADLGVIEWDGVQDHIRANISHELNVVRGQWKDGSEKTLLGMVEKRFQDRPESPSWPSSAQRFCTSDLKRDPIHKFIRNDLKARGRTVGVNCTGLRAQESSARAKKVEFEVSKRLTNKSRTVYEWLPILAWSTEEVFARIAEAGQEPHPAYAAGNDRLSCVLCIMGSRNDIANGAKARPDLIEKYAELEERTGYTMFRGETIRERAGLIATDAPVEEVVEEVIEEVVAIVDEEVIEEAPAAQAPRSAEPTVIEYLVENDIEEFDYRGQRLNITELSFNDDPLLNLPVGSVVFESDICPVTDDQALAGIESKGRVGDWNYGREKVRRRRGSRLASFPWIAFNRNTGEIAGRASNICDAVKLARQAYQREKLKTAA